MVGICPEDIELTAKQQEAMDGICEGLTEAETALKLGISRSSLYNRFVAVLKKLGAKETERRFPNYHVKRMIDYQLRHNADKINIKSKVEIEDSLTQKARVVKKADEGVNAFQRSTMAQVLEDGDAAEALHKLMMLASKAGVPKTMIDALGNRIIHGAVEVETMPEDYKEEDLRRELKKRTAMVLAHIDSATVAGAKLTDLSNAFKMLQEQQQLLDGRPTSIISVEDKQQLSEISARLSAEMARRSKTIEGECETVDE